MIAINRLGGSASPYLRGHAGQPVAWQPWDDTAVALARGQQRPILLSIGYSACHWCRVMARESFADAATAAVMNELFVCIKVDREERPDLDRMFLGALAVRGHAAGRPLTAFLTTEGAPCTGGGYFFAETASGPGRLTPIDETAGQARNGTMIGVLARPAALAADGPCRDRGDSIPRRFGDRLSRASLAAATALNNVTALESLVQIVVISERGDAAGDDLLRAAAAIHVPDRLLIPTRPDSSGSPCHPAHGKAMARGLATAYVRIGPHRLAPTKSTCALIDQLRHTVVS